MQYDKFKMPCADQILPGRKEPMDITGIHFVNDHRMKPPFPEGMQKAVFGMGCFWGAERMFWEIDGVYVTAAGYADGCTENPNYEEVCSGRTGHAEVVQVRYDASKVSYPQLLEVFWRNVDPFDAGGQFCDRGNQYRSAIFYANEREKKLAEESKRALEQKFGKDIATQIVPAATFYPAEDYHQNYYQRNPIRYKFYRYRCGRDQRLEKVWGGAGR